MQDPRTKIEKFKRLYKAEMLSKRGIQRIEFFGSTEESDRWRFGSDLDIKVYGTDIIPCDIKIEGILLIESLNYQLELGLEGVSMMHWTPIYIDDSLFPLPLPPLPPPLLPVTRRELDRMLEDELVRVFLEFLRQIVRGFVEYDVWPLTHETYWRLVRNMHDAGVPMLCQLL